MNYSGYVNFEKWLDNFKEMYGIGEKHNMVLKFKKEREQHERPKYIHLDKNGNLARDKNGNLIEQKRNIKFNQLYISKSNRDSSPSNVKAKLEGAARIAELPTIELIILDSTPGNEIYELEDGIHRCIVDRLMGYQIPNLQAKTIKGCFDSKNPELGTVGRTQILNSSSVPWKNKNYVLSNVEMGSDFWRYFSDTYDTSFARSMDVHFRFLTFGNTEFKTLKECITNSSIEQMDKIYRVRKGVFQRNHDYLNKGALKKVFMYFKSGSLTNDGFGKYGPSLRFLNFLKDMKSNEELNDFILNIDYFVDFLKETEARYYENTSWFYTFKSNWEKFKEYGTKYKPSDNKEISFFGNIKMVT